MKSLVIFFAFLNFLLQSIAFGDDEFVEIGVAKHQLTAGTGTNLVIVGNKIEMLATNDYGKPKVKLFTIELKKEDAAKIFQEINRSFSNEMFGQNRKSEFIGGVQFLFILKNHDKTQSFRLSNVRFSELDKLMELIDSYLPDKYRMRYQATLEKTVPINVNKP
jgi:uncharacterized pyridoxamine 5'-phosphate oxidase family protein